MQGGFRWHSRLPGRRPQAAPRRGHALGIAVESVTLKAMRITDITRQPLVRLRNISKTFGGVAAVQPLDMEIDRGDFVAILGPSGCGKTTLLRIIGGFLVPTTGSVEIGGVDVTRLGPE